MSESPDLVFAGVQSADSVQAATGTALADLLDLPRVAVVTKIELEDGKATVNRELEGGLLDVVEVDTPALLDDSDGNQRTPLRNAACDQAGGGEGNRRAQSSDLGQPAYRIKKMFVPPKGEGAEMLNGSAADVAQKIKEIVEESLRDRPPRALHPRLSRPEPPATNAPLASRIPQPEACSEGDR